MASTNRTPSEAKIRAAYFGFQIVILTMGKIKRTLGKGSACRSIAASPP